MRHSVDVTPFSSLVLFPLGWASSTAPLMSATSTPSRPSFSHVLSRHSYTDCMISLGSTSTQLRATHTQPCKHTNTMYREGTRATRSRWVLPATCYKAVLVGAGQRGQRSSAYDVQRPAGSGRYETFILCPNLKGTCSAKQQRATSIRRIK